ncbi:MAG: phenylalanine--tRNA ligase subunit alpha [Methanotrichaceae archaeon]|nr:phenylalanine--tRNA ligase subunit alpha [Methanotrichaceae archaeon]
MLSESEAKVLRAISIGHLDPKEIADLTGMKIEAVRSTADSLSENGFIHVEKTVEEAFSLTPEGELYAREGLPERRILEVIGEGMPISDLKDPSLKIGLGWLKRKGWASIERGMIVPATEAERGEDERALSMLLEGPIESSHLPKEGLLLLKGRGLVTSVTSKSWLYRATDAGRKEGSSAGITAETLTHITPELIKAGQWVGNLVSYGERTYQVRPYDVTLKAEPIFPGKRHPYQRMLDRMREIMLEMGFAEIKGEIVQSSFWNFDALFQPQDHPAREMQDTFYLDGKADIPDYSSIKSMHESGGEIGSTGWGGSWSPDVARREVLRTHTTAVTIKYLAEHTDPPVKAFSIDRAYRREAIDATHLPEFEQLEGVIMDEGATFANLLGVLKEFYSKMGFSEVRFRPGYFPYTEPSVEPEVYIDGLGWVELGGAGVFRREVTAPFGIEHPVLAWGLGVGRLAMLRLGLKDLRLLYQSDMGWLRETPLSTGI